REFRELPFIRFPLALTTTRRLNMPDNQSRLPRGVIFEPKRNRYKVQTRCNGYIVFLGRFTALDDALYTASLAKQFHKHFDGGLTPTPTPPDGPEQYALDHRDGIWNKLAAYLERPPAEHGKGERICGPRDPYNRSKPIARITRLEEQLSVLIDHVLELTELITDSSGPALQQKMRELRDSW